MSRKLITLCLPRSDWTASTPDSIWTASARELAVSMTQAFPLRFGTACTSPTQAVEREMDARKSTDLLDRRPCSLQRIDGRKSARPPQRSHMTDLGRGKKVTHPKPLHPVRSHHPSHLQFAIGVDGERVLLSRAATCRRPMTATEAQADAEAWLTVEVEVLDSTVTRHCTRRVSSSLVCVAGFRSYLFLLVMLTVADESER